MKLKQKAQSAPLYSSKAVSTDNEKPLFSFTHLASGYSLRECTRDEAAALVRTLAEIGERSWGELKSLDRHKCGFERLPMLGKDLPPDFMGAMPIAFRFMDMKPVIGIRLGTVFHLVWIDRGMKLYKH